MSILSDVEGAFRAALGGVADDTDELLEMIRRSQDPVRRLPGQLRHALGKQLGRTPREVAAEVVARLDVADLCQPPEVAGPGFINLRLNDAVARPGS